jgi:predicted extracellular nuclease
MRFYSFLLLIFFASCSEPKQVSPSSNAEAGSLPAHLDIAFYNVENLFDVRDDPGKSDEDFTPAGRNEWSEGRYEQKLINLSKVIQAMDHGQGLPAIIGLAEIENEEVVEALGNTVWPSGYGLVTENSLDRRGIDVALLYRKDLISIISHEALRINFEQRGYTSRDILHVELSVAGQESMHVYVNHWPSRREGQAETEHRRLDAARTLRKSIDSVQARDRNAQIIVLGDFNDYPVSKSLVDVLEAREKANRKKKDELVNLAYAYELADQGTYPYKGDWGMLDQAIVSNALFQKEGLYLEMNSLEIFQTDFMMYYDKKYKEFKPNRTYGGPRYYGGYSDHLPILLHLKTAKH